MPSDPTPSQSEVPGRSADGLRAPRSEPAPVSQALLVRRSGGWWYPHELAAINADDDEAPGVQLRA
jgi:hypothetical protein